MTDQVTAASNGYRLWVMWGFLAVLTGFSFWRLFLFRRGRRDPPPPPDDDDLDDADGF